MTATDKISDQVDTVGRMICDAFDIISITLRHEPLSGLAVLDIFRRNTPPSATLRNEYPYGELPRHSIVFQPALP
jgi:hypothetical protein